MDYSYTWWGAIGSRGWMKDYYLTHEQGWITPAPGGSAVGSCGWMKDYYLTHEKGWIITALSGGAVGSCG